MNDEKKEIIYRITSLLKQLMNALRVQYKDDVKVDRLHRQVKALIEADPKLVAEKVGHELAAHAELVYGLETAPDLAAYVNANFKIKPKSQEIADYAAHLLNLINIFMMEVPEEQCRKYAKKIIEMLNEYITYLELN